MRNFTKVTSPLPTESLLMQRSTRFALQDRIQILTSTLKLDYDLGHLLMSAKKDATREKMYDPMNFLMWLQLTPQIYIKTAITMLADLEYAHRYQRWPDSVYQKYELNQTYKHDATSVAMWVIAKTNACLTPAPSAITPHPDISRNIVSTTRTESPQPLDMPSSSEPAPELQKNLPRNQTPQPFAPLEQTVDPTLLSIHPPSLQMPEPLGIYPSTSKDKPLLSIAKDVPLYSGMGFSYKTTSEDLDLIVAQMARELAPNVLPTTRVKRSIDASYLRLQRQNE
jgi:hypothetical protein